MALTKETIAEGLRALGLTRGDVVLLHSSLASMGEVQGGASAVVDAFLSVLGEAGTLVVPTFEGDVLGVMCDVVREHPRAVRSVHPLACVAAIGAAAEEICRDHWKAETAHTDGTPYARIAEMGGYVCLLGVDQDRNTTLHTAEALLRLPYLATTPPQTFGTPEGQVTKSWGLFPGPHRDFIGLDPLLRASGKMRIGRIGNAVVRLVRSRDLIDVAVEAGRKNPAFALCENPECADCVSQRAALRRAVFRREAFTVAAAASLAGRYAEEIADACKSAGVDAVELDSLRSRPLNMLPVSTVAQAIDALCEEGIRVVSLRMRAGSDSVRASIALAKEQGVNRVVVPLTHDAPAQAVAARDAGIAISFCNGELDSQVCSALLLQMRESGLKVGFTFNGANFARCGELPFLSSYKKKLRRFVDQLDLVDGTYDGRPARLAEGNAEMKEMISILRCAGFNGYMTLGAENRSFGTLADAAARLEELLSKM